MSRPIVNTGGPGKVAADARTFSGISIAAAVITLLIFTLLNGGLHQSPEKWVPGATAGASSTAP